MKAQRFLPLLVIAAGLLAYHNSFTGPFIHDDLASIPENSTIRHLWPIWQTLTPPHTGTATVEGRPFINFSFAINYALCGYNVWGYHALNLTIHILAALTLYGIVRRTFLQPKLQKQFGAAANELALTVAVLWVVHPLQTESVTYIVQRAESLMGLFYLLTMYGFIRGVESKKSERWYLLSVAACLLGMASKEVMASAPLLVMLYDRAFVSGSFRQAWRQRWKLYLALASTWILLGYLLFFTGEYNNFVVDAQVWRIGRWMYLRTEPGAVIHYLRLSVWPQPLCFDYYGWPMAVTWTSILAAAVVGILLGTTVWALKTNSAWGILGAWFFLILAPSSSLIPTDCPVYEHRMYLPLAAVVLLGVSALYALLGRGSVVVLTLTAILFGFTTSRRNEDYRSCVSIYSDAVAKRPDNVRARCTLGNALVVEGRLPEAIADYEVAVRIRPDFAEAQNNLGLALQQTGRVPEAIDHYEQALGIWPNYARAHYNLAVALEQTGRVREAISHYEQALQIMPDSADGHYKLGTALQLAGRLSEAVAQYQQALRIKPGYPEAHNSLGIALLQSGKIPEAIRQFEDALRIRPEYPEAHYSFGIALEQAGRPEEAIGHYEQAIRIRPDFADAHNHLAFALAQTGRLPEAISHWEQALRIQPDLADAHSSLGLALIQKGRVQEAIRHFEDVVRINPDFVGARINLGNALLQNGKLPEAMEQYNQALRLDPDNANVHNNLGLALERAGRLTEAISQWEQALQIKPDFTEAQSNLLRVRPVQ